MDPVLKAQIFLPILGLLRRIGVGRPLELDIEGSKTRHCKRTFGIRHRVEFGIRPLEIDIKNSACWQMKNS